MPRSRPSTDRSRLHRLRRKIVELKSLLEVTREVHAARDESRLVRQFLRNAIAIVQAESACVFRYDATSGRLRLFDERNLAQRSTRPVAVLNADEVHFLEGEEAREGVSFSARTLSPAARAFARDQGEWLAAWEIEALVPLRTPAGLWGVAGFGRRLRGRPYRRFSLGLLASAAQIATAALEAFGAPRAQRQAAAEAFSPNVPGLNAPANEGAPPLPTDLPALRRTFPALEEIVGDSPALTQVLRELAQVAPTRVPVLILGPTGTGKELAARAVHRMSPRQEGPFEVVDCGAIPRELIESELFGHVRGSFTGATRDRRGAFELAHGGTLFLDEIGELPPGAQTRLLRVLQEGQLRRVGDERTIHVNVRVVAATNRDLAQMAQEGRFRSDLFYRVSVFTAQMPALADRREDLPVLARHFLARLAEDTGRSEPKLTPAVLRRLSEYSFPGNVRELQNVLTRLVLRAAPTGPTVEDLDASIAQSSDRTATHATPATAARVYEEDLDTPGRGDAARIGPWVVSHLRRSEFNLSQAERGLDRLQRSPAGKSAAPVADRASLNYYLQGEMLRSFHETGYDVEHATRSIAGPVELAPRVRHRLRKLLARIAEGIGSYAEEDAARRASRRLFPKMPSYYYPHVDATAVAFIRGEWAKPAADTLGSDDDDE